MFLFTDSQIVDEKMLVYVNDLLSSGEIPDLFAQEDKDEIVNAVRSETKALGLVDSTENCWATFIQKVRFCTGQTASLAEQQPLHTCCKRCADVPCPSLF